MIRLSAGAQSALRPDEILVFGWTRIPLCCATAGEPTLGLANLRAVNRSVHHRLTVHEQPSRVLVVAHQLAYPHLAKLEIAIGCRRVLGMRHFFSDLPSDFGLRAAFGSEQRPPERSNFPVNASNPCTEVPDDHKP